MIKFFISYWCWWRNHMQLSEISLFKIIYANWLLLLQWLIAIVNSNCQWQLSISINISWISCNWWLSLIGTYWSHCKDDYQLILTQSTNLLSRHMCWKGSMTWCWGYPRLDFSLKLAWNGYNGEFLNTLLPSRLTVHNPPNQLNSVYFWTRSFISRTSAMQKYLSRYQYCSHIDVILGYLITGTFNFNECST